MADPLLAILVNFNRRVLLVRALESLARQTRMPDKVVVIDNGSSDGSVAAVRAAFPHVVVDAAGENAGSAGGFARGIAAGLEHDASQLLLLDSDVELSPDCVVRLCAQLEARPDIGAVGPKVYHWDSATLLQELGGWIDWEAADLRRSHWRHDEALHGPVTADQDVEYVPACCLLATRAAIEAAGNFDPGWFLYWDDVDWCDRVRAAGFKVAVTAAARVQHFGGGANKRNLIPVYYGWRNRLTFFRRRTAATQRAATLRAYMEDYLLARFTCRALGLAKTAVVMQLGVEDALAGIFGRKDFAGIDVTLDAPISPLASAAAANVHRVHHVIASATTELAAQPGAALLDRFGKELPALHAWELRQVFEVEKARDLPSLIARAR